MDIEEDMLKYIVKYVLENCKDEMEFLDKFVEKGLIEKLEKLVYKIKLKSSLPRGKHR